MFEGVEARESSRGEENELGSFLVGEGDNDMPFCVGAIGMASQPQLSIRERVVFLIEDFE